MARPFCCKNHFVCRIRRAVLHTASSTVSIVGQGLAAPVVLLAHATWGSALALHSVEYSLSIVQAFAQSSDIARASIAPTFCSGDDSPWRTKAMHTMASTKATAA